MDNQKQNNSKKPKLSLAWGTVPTSSIHTGRCGISHIWRWSGGFWCLLLEKEMATHSSILAWRIPWTEELGGLHSTGRKESDTAERLHSLTNVVLFLVSWETPILFSTAAVPIYIPTNSIQGLPLLLILANMRYLCSFSWYPFWQV